MLKLQSFSLLIFLVIGYSAFGQNTLPFPPVHHNPTQAGESIHYKVTFGFFTVGKAQIVTSPKLYSLNNRTYYKVEVNGQTLGAVDWVAKIDDAWGTFMDSSTYYPHMGYRKIKENNYRKEELTKFEQNNKLIELKVLDNNTRRYKESKFIEAPEPARDLVSGYSFLRTIDYDKKKVGDTIRLYGVFEDELYDFKILYSGKEILKTSIGKFSTHKLTPVMPDNKLFAGKNAISIWLSADEKKIPLKIEANMVIGTAGCEITKYTVPEKQSSNP